MMIRLFENLDEATKNEISKIVTDDIRANRLIYNKRTSMQYVKQIIQTSQIVLRRCEAG